MSDLPTTNPEGYPYHGHDEGLVVTQPESGKFVEQPMTPAELIARGPALRIAKDIYRHANYAGVCYYEFWQLISAAAQQAVDAYISTLPADWFKDASLKTWFPITSENYERLDAEAAMEKAEREHYQRLAADRNVVIGTLGQEIEKLRHEVDKYDAAIASRDLEIERLRAAGRKLIASMTDDYELPSQAVAEAVAVFGSGAETTESRASDSKPASGALALVCDLLADKEEEIARLEQRCKEHDQFRHQHRHCARMGVALQRIGLLLKDAQSTDETSTDPILFYGPEHYVLSNFSAFNLVWKGLRFDTSEAAYHWEKFPDYPYARQDIMSAHSAHEAFKTAERYREARRPDWDQVKVGIMREILRAKVTQHEYVRRKLLETGDRELIEDSWRDDFWGWGPNRDGQNMLGKLWMEIRAWLRSPEKR